ncbi:MAG TPA: hypothetical protein VMX74_01945 [Pirellulales bacterium]|nr:hypothetical protein [Pirellulales bacterium]
MDFTVSLADSETGKLDNRKNVTGGVSNGLIHWTDVRVGNGATLDVDADKQADVQLDLTLMGSLATLDADSHREAGRDSQILFGDLATTVQDTTFVLLRQHVQRTGCLDAANNQEQPHEEQDQAMHAN